MDAEWHRAHVLGRGASWDERVLWHAEHARTCACRRPPEDVAAEISRREADGAGSSPAPPEGRAPRA